MTYWLFAVAAYLAGIIVGMLTLVGTTVVTTDLVGDDVRPALLGVVGSLGLALGFALVIGLGLERRLPPPARMFALSLSAEGAPIGTPDPPGRVASALAPRGVRVPNRAWGTGPTRIPDP